MQIPASATPCPVVVDLDGTLIRSDLLLECGNRWMTQHPLGFWRLLAHLAQGRAHLKAWLAQVAAPDVSALPYHEGLLAWLRVQRAAGRRLVLATASDGHLAQQVAEHLQLFDEVLASDGQTNLKAQAKRDALVARFGEQGFDYVGNDRADVSVWASAAQAHVVSDDAALVQQARNTGRLGQVFGTERQPLVPALFKAMRLHQWAKNLLVFVPLLAAHVYGDVRQVTLALLAFLAFGLAASGVYLLNDLSDVEDDRHHPRKRQRPFAAGHLSLLLGWCLWPVLLLASLALAWQGVSMAFAAALLVYVAVTTLYSFWLKQWVMVDVLTLAILYTLRIVGGGVAIAVPLSFWLLLFSMFLFLSLALIKRYSELKAAREAGRSSVLRGRGYAPDDLEMVSSLGGSAGFISVLVLALYVQDSQTAHLYAAPHVIWALCPLMLFWVSRAWLIAHRGQMHDDPIVFALRDRMSWVIIALMLVAVVLARWL